MTTRGQLQFVVDEILNDLDSFPGQDVDIVVIRIRPGERWPDFVASTKPIPGSDTEAILIGGCDAKELFSYVSPIMEKFWTISKPDK